MRLSFNKMCGTALTCSLLVVLSACGGSESPKSTAKSETSKVQKKAEAETKKITEEKTVTSAATAAGAAAGTAGAAATNVADRAANAASNAVDKASNVTQAAADKASETMTKAAAVADDAVQTVNTAASDAANALDGLTGTAAKGRRVFVKCMSCHTVREGQNRVGPSLYGIVGRDAGSIEGFNYSEANKNSGITWTEETMFAYLENPQEYIPGTRMIFPGLPAAQDRADVIAYLKSVPEGN